VYAGWDGDNWSHGNWTCGFWVGLLWLAFLRTRESRFEEWARYFGDLVAPRQHDGNTCSAPNSPGQQARNDDDAEQRHAVDELPTGELRGWIRFTERAAFRHDLHTSLTGRNEPPRADFII
jgi:hypothetical protein